jgi:hypothetical protein
MLRYSVTPGLFVAAYPIMMPLVVETLEVPPSVPVAPLREQGYQDRNSKLDPHNGWVCTSLTAEMEEFEGC